MRGCFASVPGEYFDVTSTQKRSYGGHGRKGMNLLFVDAHSQFATWTRLIPTDKVGNDPVYNFDWTAGGLKGADLTRLSLFEPEGRQSCLPLWIRLWFKAARKRVALFIVEQ